MNFRYLAAASLLTLTLGTGCVRRTTTRDFGLSPRTAPTRPKRPAALSPDASLRTVFKRQTLEALNPLLDDQRDLAASERAFQETVDRSPESDRPHNNLGYNLLLQDGPDAAEREFGKALDLNPASATARNNLGTLLARRGDLQGALEQFQMAADAAAAHNNLAVVLLEMEQYERSREE